MSKDNPSPHPLQPLLDLFNSLPTGWLLLYYGFQLYGQASSPNKVTLKLTSRLSSVQKALLERLWDELRDEFYTPTGFCEVELKSVELLRDGTVIPCWTVAKAVAYPPIKVPEQKQTGFAVHSALDASSTHPEPCPSQHQGG